MNEPRTAAGRALLGAIVVGNPAMTTFMRDRILAIEAEAIAFGMETADARPELRGFGYEAAASGLDVERLGNAHDAHWRKDISREHCDDDCYDDIAAEYARLVQEEGA